MREETTIGQAVALANSCLTSGLPEDNNLSMLAVSTLGVRRWLLPSPEDVDAIVTRRSEHSPVVQSNPWVSFTPYPRVWLRDELLAAGSVKV